MPDYTKKEYAMPTCEQKNALRLKRQKQGKGKGAGEDTKDETTKDEIQALKDEVAALKAKLAEIEEVSSVSSEAPEEEG